ncbi:hypothetical protein [Paenibacillus caui]|uniref:hypothetical protein n=1 Tax=Paenibacillus caui TaxID=2873927 RepID=UPI001F2BA726|nr:hypothetical protein [Paenibacillus caui]
MIRLCNTSDTEIIGQIINDAAPAYKGVIPDDRYHEPYMTIEELKHEVNDGVVFWGYAENDVLLGVMGIQDKGDVSGTLMYEPTNAAVESVQSFCLIW